MAEAHLAALRMKLAAIEHERWAHWQRWMHQQCLRDMDGSLVIPAALVERWERQINTPFDQLSEQEQRSDLEQVDRYWPLIEPALERGQELRAEVCKVLVFPPPSAYQHEDSDEDETWLAFRHGGDSSLKANPAIAAALADQPAEEGS